MSTNENNSYSITPKTSNYDDYKNENYVENLFSSLITLLMTPKGTHPYDPNFGVGIREFILSPDFGNLSSKIENDVNNSIQSYLPDLFPLTKVVVTRDIHESGYGYKYKLNVIVTNMVITFKMTKQGTLLYEGLINE